MSLDHADRMRTSRVQIVDVAWQRDANHVLAAPEAAQLLILDLVSHKEGGDWFVSFDVPKLAGLVAGRGQEALVVGAPSDGVDATGVSVLSFRQKFGDQLRFFSVVQEDLAIEATRSPEDTVRRVANWLAIPWVLLKMKYFCLKLKKPLFVIWSYFA